MHRLTQRATISQASRPGRTGFWTGAASCLLSGALYCVLLSGLPLQPLAWLCLVPMLAYGVNGSVVGGLFNGFVFGYCLAVGIYRWFPSMLQTVFGAGVLESWTFSLLAGVVVALPYSLLMGWLSWLRQTQGRIRPLAVGAGWVATEFVTSSVTMPNPIGLMASTQVGSAAVQAADLGGPLGVTFLIAYVNALLAEGPPFGLASHRRRRFVGLPKGVVVALAVVILTYGYGMARLRGLAGGDRAQVRVALIHGTVENELGATPEERRETSRNHFDATGALASSTVDVVLWPETAASHLLATEEGRTQLEALSASSAFVLLVGAPWTDLDSPVHRRFNSYFAFYRGVQTARYDKVRPLPFGEADPFAAILSRPRRGSVSPGSRIEPLATASGRVGVVICSEVSHSDLSRTLARRGAEWLANPSNDFWFPTDWGVRLQERAASLRAIENRRWLVRAVTTGASSIVDPGGRVAERFPGGQMVAGRGTIRRREDRTLYQFVGDLPGVAAFVFCFATSILGSSILGGFKGLEPPPELEREPDGA